MCNCARIDIDTIRNPPCGLRRVLKAEDGKFKASLGAVAFLGNGAPRALLPKGQGDGADDGSVVRVRVRVLPVDDGETSGHAGAGLCCARHGVRYHVPGAGPAAVERHNAFLDDGVEGRLQ